MAWLVFGIMIWGALMLLMGPLIKKQKAIADNTSEIDAYRLEIESLTREINTSDDPNLPTRKIELQRQLLSLTKSSNIDAGIPVRTVLSLCAFFIFGGLALYHSLGRPDLTNNDALVSSTPLLNDQRSRTYNEPASSEDLLRQLKSKLDGDYSEDPKGWFLYARSLMSSGRFDEAFEAYEQVLRLTDNEPTVQAEYQRAKDYVEGTTRRGPSAEDINNAAELSVEDRRSMIDSMVEGLAEKLRQNPENTEGWIRLLKSRKVLKQINEGQADIEILSAHYADRPDVIESILSQSDWVKQ